jgi:hypothetical protein
MIFLSLPQLNIAADFAYLFSFSHAEINAWYRNTRCGQEPAGELGRRMEPCASTSIRIIVILFSASCHHTCSAKSRKEERTLSARPPIEHSPPTLLSARFAPV